MEADVKAGAAENFAMRLKPKGKQERTVEMGPEGEDNGMLCVRILHYAKGYGESDTPCHAQSNCNQKREDMMIHLENRGVEGMCSVHALGESGDKGR